MNDLALLDALRLRILEELRRVVPPGPVALLDFPNYANPGDSAIWLGALASLAELGFAAPVFTSDHRTFDERLLRRALPSGTILLMGGGNLGDLWPGAQVLRERVLRAFPDHTVVQLPQTVHFGDRERLEQAGATFRAHANLTLLVRDASSLDVATNELGCRASLCPDLAFALTSANEPALRVAPQVETETLHLLRTDHEGTELGDLKARGVDWVADVDSSLLQMSRRLSDYLAGMAARGGDVTTTQRLVRRAVSESYAPLARRRLIRGCRLLRSARVVVTDRLHGHVLALLLGVPHVVLGDRNGKLRGFIDAWTSSSSLVRWADAPSDVDALASGLLA